MKQIAYNTSKRTQHIKYIVIHDTGNPAKGANAESHYNYFNGGDRQSSADFFIDDTQSLQVNDYNKNYTWHCGDGKGKYGITNDNSIGVEMCVNGGGTYQKAFTNTIELTRQLMAQLNISADNVVRHYDASRKNCPASFSENDWERWHNFKSRLEVKMADKPMDKHWAQDYYDYLISQGINISETRFDETITRGEVFKLLADVLYK